MGEAFSRKAASLFNWTIPSGRRGKRNIHSPFTSSTKKSHPARIGRKDRMRRPEAALWTLRRHRVGSIVSPFLVWRIRPLSYRPCFSRKRRHSFSGPLPMTAAPTRPIAAPRRAGGDPPAVIIPPSPEDSLPQTASEPQPDRISSAAFGHSRGGTKSRLEGCVRPFPLNWRLAKTISRSRGKARLSFPRADCPRGINHLPARFAFRMLSAETG